jgi:hypothetical protein
VALVTSHASLFQPPLIPQYIKARSSPCKTKILIEYSPCQFILHLNLPSTEIVEDPCCSLVTQQSRPHIHNPQGLRLAPGFIVDNITITDHTSLPQTPGKEPIRIVRPLVSPLRCHPHPHHPSPLHLSSPTPERSHDRHLQSDTRSHISRTSTSLNQLPPGLPEKRRDTALALRQRQILTAHAKGNHTVESRMHFSAKSH